MPRDEGFFQISSPPRGTGKIAGHREPQQVDFNRLQRVPEKVPDTKVVLEALVRAVLKEAELPEIPAQYEKLPFKSAKKIEALRAVELYLSSQLMQVRKEIEKVMQESVEEKDVD